MNLTCNREGLLTACSAAGSIVNSRSPKAIVRNLLLNPVARTVSATDMEIGLVYKISGISEASGEPVCIPASELLSILRELDDETITIESTQGGIRISGLTSEFELQTARADEFPAIKTEIKKVSSIKAADLVQIARRVSFAASNENSRYALATVALDLAQRDKAIGVATDGRRCAVMPAPSSINEESSQISRVSLFSPKSLALLGKLLIDPDEQVEFEFTRDNAIFRTAKISFWCRLVEGKYPRYEDVMPAKPNHKVELPVGRFCTLLRQSKILTSEQTKGVSFEFFKGTLTLRSTDERGKSKVTMPVEFDADLVITLDPQLVLDGMRVLDAESSVTLELVDGKRAALFRQPGGAGDFRFVVMPLTREKERA